MYEGAGVVVVVDVSSPSAVADAARAFDIIGRDAGGGDLCGNQAVGAKLRKSLARSHRSRFG